MLLGSWAFWTSGKLAQPKAQSGRMIQGAGCIELGIIQNLWFLIQRDTQPFGPLELEPLPCARVQAAILRWPLEMTSATLEDTRRGLFILW